MPTPILDNNIKIWERRRNKWESGAYTLVEGKKKRLELPGVSKEL